MSLGRLLNILNEYIEVEAVIYMFLHLKFSKRVDRHCEIVEKYIEKGFLLEYFELLRNDDTNKLVNHIKEHGYYTIIIPYNKDDGSYVYMFAYDPAIYSAEYVKSIYFTTSGESLTSDMRNKMTKDDQIKHGYGAQFEKKTAIVE